MISFDKFKEQVTLGYMACGNKVSISMYFCNKSNSLFTKHIEVTINAYVGPGQHLEISFDKLRESITDKIYYWYQELKDELEKLYPEEPPKETDEEMIQLEFNF